MRAAAALIALWLAGVAPDAPAQAPQLVFLSQRTEPVIDVRATPGTQDNAFGFEGGRVVQTSDGRLWLFTTELFRQPVDAATRIALWTAAAAEGNWTRVATLAVSNQSFPMTAFDQECTQSYCRNKNATRTSMAYTARFACQPEDLHASPWAPMPIFDRAADRWRVLYVGYQCDFRQLVLAGAGNIFGATSTVPGEMGIGGPYQLDGIVLGPNATQPARRFGSATRGALYIDQMMPYTLPNGSYAAILGENFWLATAPGPGGPWSVHGSINATFATAGSPYCENPVVVRLPGAGYLAVFDTVFAESRGFGVAFSPDGLTWGKGADVPLPGGCRTPLGLVQEGPGLWALLFTRRLPSCAAGGAQEDDSGGWGMAYPGQCANVYLARFRLASP